MAIRSRYVEPLDPRRPLPEGRQWFVLTCSPKREFTVARWLEEQRLAMSLTPLQIRFFSPTRHVRSKTRQRKRMAVPLVPRIVIAGFIGPVPWLTLDDCRHITGVLGIAGSPVAMRPGEAERLRETSAALLIPTPDKPVLPGAKARLTTPGLFEGHLVEVSSISGKWAKVIQSWFGSTREVRVEDR
jgi:transcription antitermination factor NusG